MGREQLDRIASRSPICGWLNEGQSTNGESWVTFGGRELTSLVTYVSSVLSAPVIDRTELTGLYDVGLEYLSERPIRGRVPGLDPNGTDVPPPTLVPALQQQLGLKLEKQIGPMPVVIIDAADHPTPD